MKTSPSLMKKYLIPSPRREMIEITEENNPYLFQIMEDSAKSLTPLADIAHLTFYDTFQVLHSYRQCSEAEMVEAGVYLVNWLITQEERFERMAKKRKQKHKKHQKQQKQRALRLIHK